jgi:chromosome partitioning protein
MLCNFISYLPNSDFIAEHLDSGVHFIGTQPNGDWFYQFNLSLVDPLPGTKWLPLHFIVDKSSDAVTHPLVLETPLADSIAATSLPNLVVLPGSRSVRDVERIAAQARAGSAVLEQHLGLGLAAWDYCLIDCPPSIGDLTRTALAGSTEVLMPIQCEYFALEGLTQMIEVIRDVMQEKPGRLSFSGIVLTMHDASLELTAEVEAEVRDFFGEIVFETVIPRDVAVSEAPSHSMSELDYATRSSGARAYTELCMEVRDCE